MDSPAFFQAAIALAVGLAAQAIAVRWRMPSILLLLVAGAAVGPDIAGWFHPKLLGSARTDLVQLAVTIILFEGGLGLTFHDLRRLQRPLALLLTLGAAISMALGTLAARLLLDMPWSVASLYGALMIVTGPTVVTPLLARVTVDRPLRDLLISEGVLVDPLGAVVAIALGELVVGEVEGWGASQAVAVSWSVGILVGVVAGRLTVEMLRREWFPEGLRNPFVFAMVLGAAALAGHLAPEAGLMAAVVQGIVVGNARLRELEKLRQFKEEMTVILLSFLFVFLAAELPLRKVVQLGWRGVAVVAVVAWVARPLAVFACTAGGGFSLRQKLFLSWISPRGVVAASVAGFFGIVLSEKGVPGGHSLEALVFVTVALTVAFQSLTARRMARVLRVDSPVLEGAMIVGANHFSRLIAWGLAATGRHALLIDQNPALCRSAQAEGFAVLHADALSMAILEEAGARYCDTLITATSNTELNLLVVQRVRDNFRIQQTLAVDNQRGARSETEANSPFPGAFTGVYETQRRLRREGLRLVDYVVEAGDAVGTRLADLPYGEEEFALILQRRGRAMVATGEQKLAEEDHLVCLDGSREPGPLASLLKVEAEEVVRAGVRPRLFA